MKLLVSVSIFLFITFSVFAQRIVFPSQNQFYPFLEDPSHVSHNGAYNMTGMLQVSDTETTNTSQYLAAQLSPFSNVAFGLDYAKHSYGAFRYSHIMFNSRVRLELGNKFNVFNFGLSVGPDKLNLVKSSKAKVTAAYRLALHYTRYDFTIGGFLNHNPIQSSVSEINTPTLIKSRGYVAYVSYNFALSDNFRLTPLFRYNAYESLNIEEGVALMNYKGNYEMALSYKNDYGLSVALSGKVSRKIKLSYSYEKALGVQNFDDVHAIGLSVDLSPKGSEPPEWLVNVEKGNEKIRRIKPKKEKKPLEERGIPVFEFEEEENDSLSNNNISVKQTNQPMREDDPDDIVDNHLKPGYYLVLGSFKEVENAEKELERLKKKGFYARYGKKNAQDQFNYVYVDRYIDKSIATKKLLEKQNEKGLERTWLLLIK